MRAALATLTIVLSIACATTSSQPPNVSAQAPTSDETSADAYEQYVDEFGHVVTHHTKTPTAEQSTHDRLFNHWTSADLFTR